MPTRIALVATGGTIACTLDADGYAVKTLDAADLAATARTPGIDFVPVDYGRLSSWNIDPPTMLALTRLVDEVAADVDGVVVTHGTDTLEETAAFFSYATRTDAPVVVTGAMRTMSEPGPDGPANVRAAALVAADQAARGRGALVVMNDEIHRAVEVTKRHSSNPATFGSPYTGPVGWVDGGRVTFRVPPQPPTRYDVRAADARVPLVTAAAGADPALVEAAAAACDALVVAGFGLGHVPAGWVEALAGAVGRDVPVVMASRTHAGPTGAVYRGPGGGVDVRDRGVLEAGYRSAYCARIELICALGAGCRRDEIRAAFARPLP
jgi:L-asparaginase